MFKYGSITYDYWDSPFISIICIQPVSDALLSMDSIVSPSAGFHPPLWDYSNPAPGFPTSPGLTGSIVACNSAAARFPAARGTMVQNRTDSSTDNVTSFVQSRMHKPGPSRRALLPAHWKHWEHWRHTSHRACATLLQHLPQMHSFTVVYFLNKPHMVMQPIEKASL